MKRYLITGASRGIGRAIAERLAEAESMLFLHGRDRDALAETRRRVEAKGARASLLCYDLREISGVEQLLAEMDGQPLDALINNAGIAIVKPLAELSVAEWQSTFAVNVTAPFLLTQRLTKTMPAGGAVVNILSIAAKNGFAGWSSYCASKFALEGFSQAVREELRPRGIRVINLYPAATETEIWNSVAGEWPRQRMLPAAEVAEAVAYALSRPEAVSVEGISLTNSSGTL
jgi:short-subunit dehydrogenase